MPYLIFIMVSIPKHQVWYHRSNQTNKEEHGHLLDLYQNILNKSNVDIVIMMIMVVVPMAMMVVVMMMIVAIDLFQSFANDSVHYERPND